MSGTEYVPDEATQSREHTAREKKRTAHHEDFARWMEMEADWIANLASVG